MAPWKNDYVHTNESTLHYYRTGGEKPQIILLHGFTDNGLCWSRLAKDLEQSYDVIMLDARGHGRSDGPKNGFSYELLAADVAAVIQALHLSQPSLLGHSMGAHTAALVAARYPELVQTILLEDPPWNLTEAEKKSVKHLEEASAHPWYEWLASLKVLSRQEQIATAHRENTQWSEEELEPWADSKSEFNVEVLKYGLPPALWRSYASQIAQPTLLLTGDPDLGAIVTPEVALEASHLLQKGSVAHIHGAGHSIRRDQYDRYKETVVTFLREQ